MTVSSPQELLSRLQPSARVEEDRLVVADPDRFRSEVIDALVFEAVFNEDAGLRDAGRWDRRERADVGQPP